MARGYFIRVGDRTTCGGTVLSGDPRHTLHGLATARNGDTVTCGKDGRVYRIAGGLANYIIHGAQAAGTLHSRSTCPCNAGLIASLPEATYWEEEGIAGGAALLTVPLAAIPSAKVDEPVQHAQVTKKQSSFAETCDPEDNGLLNGVYIWTEITDTGHAFVSVHENNNIYLYTYGRYGRTGSPFGMTGDGILDFMKGDDARDYYRKELYENNARVFKINDASINKVRAFFEGLWIEGKKPIAIEKNSATERTGHSIDSYDVTGSNCTTHTVAGIKAAGSEVFDISYKSTTTQISIESEEYFTIPASLQKYLITKSQNLQSMIVLEVTTTFRKQYPNIKEQHTFPEGSTGEAKQYTIESMSAIGSISPYSGENVGGLFGEYDE